MNNNPVLRVARKRHDCAYGDGPIMPNTMYVSMGVRITDKWKTLHFHNECFKKASPRMNPNIVKINDKVNPSGSHTFCRLLLKEVMREVRQHVSKEKIKDVWAYKEGKSFEFHGPDGYYLMVNGDCKYSALADGWYKYLRHMGIEGYNPVQNGSNVKSDLFESFHGNPPEKMTKVYYEPPKGSLVKIGDLSEIKYKPTGVSKYKNTEFYHKAGDIGSKIIKGNAILATNQEGTQLYIVKKDKKVKYPIFTSRGILG